MDSLGPIQIQIFYHQPEPMTYADAAFLKLIFGADTTLKIQSSRNLNLLSVTLGTSNILTL